MRPERLVGELDGVRAGVEFDCAHVVGRLARGLAVDGDRIGE